MNNTRKAQNNGLPLYPLASSSARLGDPHLHPGHHISLPALNRKIHHEASAPRYFLPCDVLRLGVSLHGACENALLGFAVAWGVCACLKHGVRASVES